MTQPLVHELTYFCISIQNSVRHNLSSGRAFIKMERSTGEHGKGFFWSVDAQHEHTFAQQEARAAAQAHSHSATATAVSASGKDVTSKSSRKKDKAVPLDPPLKRSVKSGTGPLPPPLTSTPLVSSLSRTQASSPGQPVGGLAHARTLGGPFTTVPRAVITGNIDAEAAARETKSELTDVLQVSGAWTPTNMTIPPSECVASSSALSSDAPPAVVSSSSVSASPFATLPPSVCLPLVIGSVPSSHPSGSTPDPQPIVLHNNTLVLSPIIFSSLAPEQLKALEEMGAQKALEVLQGHIVRYLKERMGKKKRKKTIPGGAAEKGVMKTGKDDTSERSSPFTTIPLPLRTAQSTPTPTSHVSHPLSLTPTTGTTLPDLSGFCTPVTKCSAAEIKEGVPSPVDNSPPVPVPIPDNRRSQTPVIVVDDEDDKEGRARKRRKLGNKFEVETELKHEVTVAQVSQAVDEDIEVDVC